MAAGTWARTPEQLYFCDPTSVKRFPALQKSIAKNVCAYLKNGGRLIYITCSVFKQENEEVVNSLVAQGMELVQSALINGIGIKADSMFVAVLRKK